MAMAVINLMWKHDRFFESTLVALVFLAFAGPHLGSLCAASLGVNYGKVANNLPAPAEVVGIIQSLSITKAKLYDPDPLVLKTFQNTDISFLVGTRNEDLENLNSRAYASTWIQQNILAYHPSTNIIGVVVGNEIFSSGDAAQMARVLPAMKNIYSVLSEKGLQRSMVVSTTHSFGVLTSSFPPSTGSFNPAIANLYIEPILQFLTQVGSPFMINAYPFFAYKENPTTVSLAYALFEPNEGVVDSGTGLHYTNMFDAQLDAVYSAMAVMGYKNISLLVSETGWPSSGDANELGATLQNAKLYHNNLYKHLNITRGTPLRPNNTLDVYLFALFNEDNKPGPTSEKNYGLFYPTGKRVYEFDLKSSSPLSHQASTEVLLGCSIFIILAVVSF